MSKRLKVAFLCHLIALLSVALIGVIYLFRGQFMPYHAVALRKDWAGLDRALQVLLLALMKAAGGGALATAVAMGILLLIPFRQGLYWARWAIPVVGLVWVLPNLYVSVWVALNTPASPPWRYALVVVALLIAGFVLSMESKGTEQASPR